MLDPTPAASVRIWQNLCVCLGVYSMCWKARLTTVRVLLNFKIASIDIGTKDMSDATPRDLAGELYLLSVRGSGAVYGCSSLSSLFYLYRACS